MQRLRFFVGCLAALATLAAAATASAQTTPTRLRGTITAIDGKTVSIATREGPTVDVKLSDNWVVALVAPLAMADIKDCLLYTSPSPRDQRGSRMPSSA